MIFDIDIELQLLESQPEWIGIQERIVSLNDQLQRNVIAFDKSPDKYNQKRIEKTESDIKFFENILLFWASNYQKLKNLSQAVNHQVEASNNGTDWNIIWQHTGSSDITDSDWQLVEDDMSSVANGQKTVYVRWCYEIIDSHAYPYSGWNIDEIRIIGDR